ncbi:transposase [Streptomyces sp. Cmuel-A718b]|uniref:transposase n=1 Tax=unclassified Streptomyces TaxID=2593676 RepID=UPI000B84C694|nr:transposase [Streptomyces sp. Cmuel-A718b]
MSEPFARADQHRWGGICLRGLLLDGRREPVEPVATRPGEDGNRQALARFVTPARGTRRMCGPGRPGACSRSPAHSSGHR